jgi:hypothetical protein
MTPDHMRLSQMFWLVPRMGFYSPPPDDIRGSFQTVLRPETAFEYFERVANNELARWADDGGRI